MYIMEKNTIKVFARIKPTSKQTNDKIYEIVKKPEYHELTFNKSDENIDVFSNKNKQVFKYRFHHIFQENSVQKDVFERLAKPVVNSVFEGYNGTIFAYGQTGCGKTYSMRGVPEDLDKKGIIPRTFHYIFNYIKKTNKIYTILISYMEIYNEIAYDLLKFSDTLTLEELPRVVLLEDGDGNLNIRNLRIESIVDEKEAMQFLKLGESNRKIAETPLNPRSSRSHCVFTIYVSGFDSDGKVQRSKLHLVDLAGSERVYKSCLTGLHLTDALNINLSLHFLEQVILALSETKRTHIPYRNSIMTNVLRDSLGGNCMAVMLTALSSDIKHINESISTCKFSQRVAMVKTQLSLNTHIDPQEEIVSLKLEIESLKKQLNLIKNNYSATESNKESKEELTEEEKKQCKSQLQLFLEGSTSDLLVTSDSRKTNFYLRMLRDEILSQNKTQSNLSDPKAPPLKTLDPKVKRNKNFEKEFKLYEKYALDLNEKEKEAFKTVMDDPKNMVEINMHIASLKEKYASAKTIADRVEQCKQNVVNLKKRIENCTSMNAEEKSAFVRKLKIHENIYDENVTELQRIKKETDVIKQNIDKAKVTLINKTRDVVKKSEADNITKEILEKNNSMDRSKFFSSGLFEKQEYITNNLMTEVFGDRYGDKTNDKFFDYPEKLYSKEKIKERSNGNNFQDSLLNNKIKSPSSEIDQIFGKSSRLDDIKQPPGYVSAGTNKSFEYSQNPIKQNYPYQYTQPPPTHGRYPNSDQNDGYDGELIPQRPYSSFNNYLSQNENYFKSTSRSSSTSQPIQRDYYEAEKYNRQQNYQVPDDIRLSTKQRKGYEDEERFHNERFNMAAHMSNNNPPINYQKDYYQRCHDKAYVPNEISPKPIVYHPEQFYNFSHTGNHNPVVNVQSAPYKPPPPPINLQRDYYGLQNYHQEKIRHYPTETHQGIDSNLSQNTIFRNEIVPNFQQQPYQNPNEISPRENIPYSKEFHHFTQTPNPTHYPDSQSNPVHNTIKTIPNEILTRNNPTDNTNTTPNHQYHQNHSTTDQNRTITENVRNQPSITSVNNSIPPTSNNNQNEITSNEKPNQESRCDDIPLTGDPDVDAEIIAFYKSRD